MLACSETVARNDAAVAEIAAQRGLVDRGRISGDFGNDVKTSPLRLLAPQPSARDTTTVTDSRRARRRRHGCRRAHRSRSESFEWEDVGTQYISLVHRHVHQASTLAAGLRILVVMAMWRSTCLVLSSSTQSLDTTAQGVVHPLVAHPLDLGTTPHPVLLV